MQTENLTQAIEIITAAQTEVAELTKDFPSIALKVNSNLTQSINALSHAAGVSQPAPQSNQFGPIKTFMGKKIENKKVSVKQEAINPDDETKKAFQKKVNDLYNAIDSQESTEILKNNTIPEDVLALRGVAKKAGVSDFEDAELNVAFVDAIKAGKATKEADKKAKDAIKAGKAK